MRKRIIIVVLLLISVSIIPFVIFSLQFFAMDPGNGVVPPPLPPSTESNVLNPIVPNPDTDGTILLYWGALDTSVLSDFYNMPIIVYYDVLRSKDGGSWITIEEDIYSISDSLSYTDVVWFDGTYEYKIKSKAYIICLYDIIIYTNVVSIVVNLPEEEEEEESIYPSDPSIRINDGDETTNSFEVILTLSCVNADEMQFQIIEGWWTNWTAYSTTYTITLFENDPFYPDYRVGVVFRNEVGTTGDVGYGDIYDDITYKPPEEPPPPPEDGEDTDYTLLYVLLGVLVGLVGIGIFLTYRKQIIKSK